MPLQTAEAPITADLAPGNLQSLPVFNPTADSTRTQVISTLDMAEKAKAEAGAELWHEHKQVISGLNGQYLLDRAISMKKELSVLAGDLVLMIVCQIMVLRPLNARDEEELIGFFGSPASAIFFFCAISGVVLDVLGIVFALISFLAVRKTVTTIRKVSDSVCGAVWNSSNTTQLPKYCNPRRGCTIPLGFPDDLRRLLHIMDHHSNVNFGVFIISTAGIVFFAVSLCTFVIATLPVAMGVPLALVTILLLFALTRCTWTYWGKLISYGRVGIA